MLASQWHFVLYSWFESVSQLIDIAYLEDLTVK